MSGFFGASFFFMILELKFSNFCGELLPCNPGLSAVESNRFFQQCLSVEMSSVSSANETFIYEREVWDEKTF